MMKWIVPFWKFLYLDASFQLCMRGESECKHWNKGDTRNNSIFLFFHKRLESLVFLAEILPKILRFGDLIVRLWESIKIRESISRLNRETWQVCCMGLDIKLVYSSFKIRNLFSILKGFCPWRTSITSCLQVFLCGL